MSFTHDGAFKSSRQNGASIYTPSIKRQKKLNPDDMLVISNFDGGYGVEWTDGGGTGTPTDVTENMIYSDAGIRVPSAVGGTGKSIEKALSPTIDVTQYPNFSLSYYANGLTDSNLAGLHIWFWQGSNYQIKKMFRHASRNVDGNVRVTGNIYSNIPIIQSATPPDFTLIDKIEISVIASTGESFNVDFDNLHFWKDQDAKGNVIIHFDDQREEVYTNAMPFFDKYGFVGEVAVNASRVGQTGYMTLDQLLTLQDKGWSIISHCYEHLDLTTLSEGGVRFQIEENIKYMKQNGLLGTDILALPFNSINASVKAICKEYHNYCRTSLSFDGRMETFPFGDDYNIHARVLGATTSLATATALVDVTETAKGTTIFYEHDPTTFDFDGFMSYLNGKKSTLNVTTLTDYINF